MSIEPAIKRHMLLLSISLLSTFNMAQCQQLFPKMYDAFYTYELPGVKTNVRLSSNGKGKVREEVTSGSGKSVTITDYANKLEYTIIYRAGLIVKRPLTKSFEEPSEASMKRKGGKYLGTKLIGGLQCQGWRFETPGSESEMWSEKNFSFIVLSKSKVQNKNYEMVLTKSSKEAPPSDLFELPSGMQMSN